jgi:predicted kinase
MTYKIAPGGNPVTIDAVYDREHARAVLYAAAEDYAERFVARS